MHSSSLRQRAGQPLAHTQYVVASQPAETVPALTDKLKALVDPLWSDAIALSKRGFVDPERL
ncbi:MAG: hypothetical protein JNL21_35360, partial [Myxococcales bacterium]|nr:hypothetical protein [Myxococcales bacterium]